MTGHIRKIDSTPDSSARPNRVVFFDTVRGATILSMVAFHTMYDLVYLYGIQITWFTIGPLQELWRISISWVFLALAGWMTSFSRSNVQRACLYSIGAMLIWVVTTVVAVDTPISFGILFCMAGCTWLWAFIEGAASCAVERCPHLLAGILLAGFLVLYQVPRHTYEVPGLAWLGFPTAGFASGDYYPLVPFSLLYLAFAILSYNRKKRGKSYPTWMYRNWIPPLSYIGTKSLPIYLLHQVVILVVLNIVMG